MLKSLDICGFRGFATNQTLSFAVPNGQPGSGLTVIVGANNAGKSTVVESLRAVAQRSAPSFAQGRRNQLAGDKVLIRVDDTDGRSTTLKSIRAGGSETEYVIEGGGADLSTLLVLPARRAFTTHFGRASTSRAEYMANIGFPTIRASTLDYFTIRLFAVAKNRDSFDALLKRVIDPVPDWSIDQMDTGQYFLKVRKGDATHSSEGLGEGLVSLLYIIDALYDSKDGDVIAIDEPELSLHPSLQRKLYDLLLEYSATRQIVISTHSHFFVGLDALQSGATVARVHVVDQQSRISQLSSTTAQAIFGLMQNDNNPHILGLQAREIFFVEDNVILVEGQEDVVFFQRVEAAIERLEGTLFGWGVGGSSNMASIASVLQELGFSKVVGILDADQAKLVEDLAIKFPNYHFFAIPANSVRTKAATKANAEVKGLLDDNNDAVRPEHIDEMRCRFAAANAFLRA